MTSGHEHDLKFETICMGLFLGLLSSAFSEAGNISFKLYANERLMDKTIILKSKWLWISIGFIFIGACLTGISLNGLVPLEIYHVGTALNIPIVIGMAFYVFEEKVNYTQIAAVVVMVVSAIFVAYCGTREKNPNPLEPISISIHKTEMWVFVSCCLIFQTVASYFSWKRYKIVQRLNSRNDNIDERHCVMHIPGETKYEYVFNLLMSTMNCSCQLYWVLLMVDLGLYIIRNLIAGTSYNMAAWVSLPLWFVCNLYYIILIQWMLACYRAIVVLPVYIGLMNLQNATAAMMFLRTYPSHYFGFYFSLTVLLVAAFLFAYLDEGSAELERELVQVTPLTPEIEQRNRSRTLVAIRNNV